MGSPVSPIVANLYMRYFEQKAFVLHITPRLWQRYVDDTFVIQKEVNKQDFLQHINSVDPAIQFTVENNKEVGALPFLDTIAKPEADGNLSITVYMKPTHTDQYLQWDSHHHLSANLVLLTPSPIGLKQYVAMLNFSAKKMITSGRHSPNANTLNGLWTRWRTGLTGLPRRLLMGLTIRAPQVPSPPPTKLKPRVTLLYLIHRVSVKTSIRSVGGMAYRPTSKVVAQSIIYWSPTRTKTPWSAKVGPYIGSNVVTLPVMMNTWGKPPGLLVKDSKSS